MNVETLLQESAARFLPANAIALDMPPLTRDGVESSAAVGAVVRLSDGTPVLQVEGRLLGAPMPQDELDRTVRSGDDTTLFVVFGLGMGHVPRALRRKTRAPIIVYEPSLGLLRTALQSGPLDLSDIPIASGLSDLANVWGRYAGQRRDAVLLHTPGYSAVYPDAAAAVTESIRRLVERIAITQNTYRKRARTWVTDVLQNVELLTDHPPALALEGKFKNVPAFIIGAGPSLDKNIHLLAEAARKGLVFASNSSGLALGKLGIVPQFLACIESIDISSRLETIPFLDQTIRLFSLSASPETLRTGNGPLLPFYEGIPQYSAPLEELTGVGGVGICGSVSTAAFSIAQKLGCNPIILVGQDMAFTSGRTYAGGTGYESSRAEFDADARQIKLKWNDEILKLHGTDQGHRHVTEPLSQVPAWGGGKVYSGSSFTAINSWLEATAAMAKRFNENTRFINATEGGASVAGFDELPLEQVLSALPTLDLKVESIVELANADSTCRSREQLQQWARGQIRLTREIRRRARHTRRVATLALDAITKDVPRKITRAFTALDLAESQLKKAVFRAPLIDAWTHAQVDSLLALHDAASANASADARTSARGAITLGAKVAKAIEGSATELETILDTLVSRLAEHRTTTKRSLLCL